MPVTPRSPLAAFSDALNLIASGTMDEKVHWIAEHDPDWFVAHVLSHTLGIADSAERGVRLEERLVDQAVAAIALRDSMRLPLRNVG